MSAATDVSAPSATPSRALRIVVSLIAFLECIIAFDDLPSAFIRRSEMSAGQYLINVVLIVHPLFALAGLVLAAIGRVREALIVLGAYVLVGWLAELPGLVQHGFEGELSTVGLSVFGQQVLFPLLALAAIVLAAKNTRLWLATLFVALPPLNLVLGVAIFTIAVIMYGF